MARLNIEDQFWIDVMQLVAKMGDQDRAIGQAIRFLRFAQEKFRNGEEFFVEDFDAAGFDRSLIGVFAKQSPSKVQANRSTIQARGSNIHFGWLVDRKEAAKRGGKQSAQRQRDEKGRLLSKQNPSEPKCSQASPSISPSSRQTEESILLFEAGFSQDLKAFNEISEKLFKEFKHAVPTEVKNAAPKLKLHFGDAEKYREWINELIGNEKQMGKVERPGRYLKKCILDEIGGMSA